MKCTMHNDASTSSAFLRDERGMGEEGNGRRGEWEKVRVGESESGRK